MSSLSLDLSVRRLVIDSINAYQKFLSPHKGFACPHRLLHGGASCSEHIKDALGKQDIGRAAKAALQQFDACAEAGRTLRRRGTQGAVRCIVLPCCFPL